LKGQLPQVVAEGHFRTEVSKANKVEAKYGALHSALAS